LAFIFSEYGELTNAKKMALQWIKVRQSIPIHRCTDFADWASAFSYGKKTQFLAQLFQALRIEVNQELEALKELLAQCEEVIQPGGRLVIISYHSLEDRLAKQWTKYGNPNDDIPSFSPAFKQAVLPTEEEVNKNSRARSAKMRVGIKK
jgi:16S rRNA (cytosine1402-N4)-methyltransferase